MTLPDDLARRLRGQVIATQRRDRVPMVAFTLAHHGEPVLQAGAGDPEPTPATQYRIGSITKTFTAVLVMGLRDEGRLRLDDTLDVHVPGTALGDLRIRDLLAHRSGMRREPPGDFWEASAGRPEHALLAGLSDDALVLPSQRAFHYSNVAYGLLGLVVERLTGGSYAEALTRRVLRPLGLAGISYHPREPYARGVRVHPFADSVVPEPVHDTGAMAPAGQLWGTADALAEWGAFLADPVAEVLAPATVDEMCEPTGMSDRAWTRGYGLGLELFRHGEYVLVGHGGSMPGYRAWLAVSREHGVSAAACGNAWSNGDLRSLTCEAVVSVVDAGLWLEPWRPAPLPAAYDGLLGTWWWRDVEMVVSAEGGGMLLVRAAADVAGRQAERFAPAGRDLFRGVDGGDRGETLRVLRDGSGHPYALDVATWVFTRDRSDPRGGP